MKGKSCDMHCSSVLFSRSRARTRHPSAMAKAVGRSLWLAAVTVAVIAAAATIASANEWQLGGTGTTPITNIIMQQPVAESSDPKNDSGGEARPVESSRESIRPSRSEPDAVVAEPKQEPPRPVFVSYMALHNSAMRRGGYRPGQVVCIANRVDDLKAEAMQRSCLINGYSFCTASQDDLDPGFTWHRGDEQGLLREIGSRPVTQYARYRAPDAFNEMAIPAVIREYQPRPVRYVQDSGACADGSCSMQSVYEGPVRIGRLAESYQGGYGYSGSSCADGSCGGGQQVQSYGGGYQGFGGQSSGGGFISRLFSGGGGCANGACGS